MSITDISAMDQDAFVAAFGGLFEHSPWVAESAWTRRPFKDAAALHAAMMAAVRNATEWQQIAFLNMHPELAGKEMQAGTMTEASTFEQQGAGLNALTAAEVAELRALNGAYARRHRFPFIIAVLGHSKAQIFDALRIRIGNDTQDEIEAALDQVGKITWRRLVVRLEVVDVVD